MTEQQSTTGDAAGPSAAGVQRADTRTSTPSGPGKGVDATWWYTFTSAIFIVAMTVYFWAAPVLLDPETASAMKPLNVAAGICIVVAFIASGMRYRRRGAEASILGSWQHRAALAAGLLAAGAFGLTAGSSAVGLSFGTALLSTLTWPKGVRGRVIALATFLVAALSVVEFQQQSASGGLGATTLFLQLAFATFLPVGVVSMFWWWDIVRELDHARTTESKLAATRERLRLASDVHDLQGHHLQVIALQLELAERLLAVDPGAALDQLKGAQRSVDAARAGTRDLATRFRGVPLPDELANAADLLRAAGLKVRLDVEAGAEAAPSDTLGAVVRESTTNILKHGGGTTASLRLRRDGDAWRYTATNDVEGDEHDAGAAAGTGLAGMAERVDQAGGSLTAGPFGAVFTLDARVPAPARIHSGGRP